MRAAQANPWIGVNFLHDNVRMAVPPAFFLQRFHDFDADIVIVPSRQVPFAYVIARRKRYSVGITDKALIDTIVQPDTKMCMQYGLVPVCLMYQHGTIWNPDAVLVKLKARDLWAHGGANAVADMLEEQEEAEKAKLKADIRDDMWNRSGDAWRSYQARTGQRTAYTGKKRTRGGAYNSPPSSSTATTGNGIVIP